MVSDKSKDIYTGLIKHYCELKSFVKDNDRGVKAADDIIDALLDYNAEVNRQKEEIDSLIEQNKNLKNKVQSVHEELCKYDWKNSTSEQIYNQLSSLYKAVFDENNTEV